MTRGKKRKKAARSATATQKSLRAAGRFINKHTNNK